MVGVYQPRDIGGELGGMIGGGLGKGFGEGMEMLGQRKQARNALQEALDKQEDPDSLQSELLRGLMPFVNVKGMESIASEMPRVIQKEYARKANIPKPVVSDKENLFNERIKREKEAENSGERLKVAPTFEGIPHNTPLDVKDTLKSFPNYMPSALRGDPNGLNQIQKDEIAYDYVKKGGSFAEGERRANTLSDYLQGQAEYYQNILDEVSSETERMYKDSPLKDIFQSSMLKDAERQMETGRLEPNSLKLSIRRKAKDLESSINRIESIEGRPIWGYDQASRKQKSANVIQPFIKNGELQTAVQLLTSNDLGLDPETGVQRSGPDWGPVKASEIVFEQSNPIGVKNIKKFAENLDDAHDYKFVDYNTRKEVVDRNLKKITEYLSDPNKFTDKDSLVLLRYNLKKKGIDESEFNQALSASRSNREFSDYQNFEQSQYLPVNIRPSLTEMLNGVSSFYDWKTGKL